MEKNKQIETSRRVYTWLLGLYPQEHRSEYGVEMTRLFTDQCRAAVNQRGGPGLVALWLRTLVDLGKTALIEHLTSPQAKTGLLQATPGMALPWKGVLLVLIPGLVFFISQVGQLTGKDWFFSTLNWASYAFLVPVVIVWYQTRKFPVWGFIPLGLAFRSLFENWNWLYRLSLVFVLPLRELLKPANNLVVGDGELGVPLIFLILITIMAVLVYRRQKFNRTVWLWLGVYALLVMVPPGLGLLETLKKYQLSPKYFSISLDLLTPLIFNLIDSVSAGVFLLLILLGAWLAQRQGRVVILLLIGYLLPVILYGTYATYPGGNSAIISPVWINTAVFIYRLCLAILAPLWLVRSVSRRQILAAMIPVGIALLSQAGLQTVQILYWRSQALSTWLLNNVVVTISKPMMIVAGFILALVLYRSRVSTGQENLPADAPAQVAAGE